VRSPSRHLELPLFEESAMDCQREVLSLLDEVLSLGGRAHSFAPTTHLLGAIPELDSMAVVALITALEERFGFMIDDDEISGETFASVGSLVDFVERKRMPVKS
jgi:acyl carrier protein